MGENDTLFGSVTTGDIADALAARDVTVDRRKIQLADPLKTLGEHVVPVKLHRDVTAQLKVRIVAGDVTQRLRPRPIPVQAGIGRCFVIVASPMAERTLPHNLEAEKCVLGAILIDNPSFNQAAEVIDAHDFFRDAHRRIFEKMVALSDRSQPIDPVTLKDELTRTRRAGRGRRARVRRLADRRRAAVGQRRVLRARSSRKNRRCAG